jgi:hypothetical protein
MINCLCAVIALVSFMDSLDSTLDKDSKPARGRLNDDMRPIAELTGEQRLVTDTGHDLTSNKADDDAGDEEEEEEGEDNENGHADNSDGYDEVDGTMHVGSMQNVIGSVTQMEDDGTDNKITDTTMTGVIGKTVSG